MATNGDTNQPNNPQTNPGDGNDEQDQNTETQ